MMGGLVHGRCTALGVHIGGLNQVQAVRMSNKRRDFLIEKVLSLVRSQASCPPHMAARDAWPFKRFGLS